MNKVCLVGRIADKPKFHEENGNKFLFITLAVTRPFENENGEYETDFIKCKLSQRLGEKAIKYCTQGKCVGIQGNLQAGKCENEVIVDKFTCIS